MVPWLFLLFAAQPDPGDLFRSAITAREAQAAKKFTYREDVEQVRTEKSTIETFDVIMLEGENYRKLILIDGKPLDAKRQKQVDADLEKARSARRRSTPFNIRRTAKIGGLADIQRLFDCKVTGEEIVNGRKTWRLEAQPKTGIKPANKQEQNMLATKRTIWFDQQEHVDIQSVIVYLQPAEGFQPGSELEYQFSKVNDVWLAASFRFRFHLKAMAFVNARGEARHRFYDYKLFQTESTLIPQ
jgi:hypothetical protein